MTATTISTKTTTAKTIGGGDSLTITAAGGISAADSVVLLNFSQAGIATVDNSGSLVATTGRVFYTTGTAASPFSFVLYNRSGGTITGKTDVLGTNKKTFAGGDFTVDNAGSVTAQGGRAFNVNEYINLADFTFTNRAGGTVQSTDDGLRLSTTTTGATASANAAFTGFVNVDNSGTIRTVGTGSGQAIDFADLNETAIGYVVITNRATGLIQAADADAIRASRNADIENYGTIQSQNATSSSTGNDGIDFQSNDGGIVTNFQGGSIIGARHGITGTQALMITNDGAITGQLGSAINLDTASTTTSQIINDAHGVITGTAGGTPSAGVDGDGIDVDGLVWIDNYGDIEAVGHAAGPVTEAGESSTPLNEAITIGGGRIVNYAGALIHSVERAITVDDSNGGNAFAATTIINHGTITADNGSAIFITDILGDTITNDGTINGSVTTGDGNDAITNSGTLKGALATRSGADAFYLSGSSIGAIDGGAGSDVIHVMGSSTQLTFTGVTNVEQLYVDAGALTIADAESYSSGTTIASGATLTIGSGTAGSLGGSIADSGTLVFARMDSLAENDAISGSGVVKAAGGTLVLSGDNSFSGGLELVSGTAEIGSQHGAGTGTISFDDGAQTLRLDAAAFSNGDFANVIDTFAHADRIDLAGVSAGATLSLDGSNMLTVTDGASSYTLHFDPAQMFGDQRFHLAADGNGGAFLSFADDVAPVAAAASFSTDEDMVLHGTVSASDADGDGLTYAVDTGPQHGSLVLNADGSFTYTADANYNGADSFTFKASDGTADSAPGTISLTVDPVNDAPLLTGTQATLADATEDTAYTIKASDLLAGYTDVDGDTLAVSALTASNGTITDNGDGTYTVVPSADFNGPVTLNYDVVDGHGGSAHATLGYQVDAVNDDPAMTGAAAMLARGTEDQSYVLRMSDLLVGYGDVDGDSLAVANLTADHGTVTDNGDGTYTITEDANFNGKIGLSYDVVDGNGGTVHATQIVKIDAVDDAPDGLALVSGGSVAENSARGTIVATFAGHDVDSGDKLRYTLADDANGAFSIDAKTGIVHVLDPSRLDNEAATSKTIDVVVTDADGLSTHQQFIIQVTNVVETHIYSGTSRNDSFTATGAEPYLIKGNAGDDVLTGGDGNDTILGGTGFDQMHGGLGDDMFVITGRGNLDSFDGGDGHDVILAGENKAEIGIASLTSIEEISADGHKAVTVIGSEGGDTLDFSAVTLTGIGSIQGLGGDDRIIGSAAADRIIGGAGQDIMTGGDGADIFVFTKPTETAVGTQADHITDFVSGQDVIDLSAIDANSKVSGNQAFTFIDGDQFTGLGQLRVGMDDAGHLAIFGNSSGDLKADFEIILDATPTVHAGDFVL